MACNQRQFSNLASEQKSLATPVLADRYFVITEFDSTSLRHKWKKTEVRLEVRKKKNCDEEQKNETDASFPSLRKKCVHALEICSSGDNPMKIKINAKLQK